MTQTLLPPTDALRVAGLGATNATLRVFHSVSAAAAADCATWDRRVCLLALLAHAGCFGASYQLSVTSVDSIGDSARIEAAELVS